MSRLIKNYMAGYFDGEGSISILRDNTYKNNNGVFGTYYLQISLGQKDGRVMDWIVENFGGSIYQVKRDNSFYWIITNRKAYRFIKTIVSYLKYKKPQAELAIKFYEEHIQGRKDKKESRKEGINEQELKKREEKYLEMRRLKKEIIPPKQFVGSETKRTDLQQQDAIVRTA